MSKYYIEIDTNGAEAHGYEDQYLWVCYGTIISEGDTLEELLESATVDLIDQDGGEVSQVEADDKWMQDLVRQEFEKLVKKENSNEDDKEAV